MQYSKAKISNMDESLISKMRSKCQYYQNQIMGIAAVLFKWTELFFFNFNVRDIEYYFYK